MTNNIDKQNTARQILYDFKTNLESFEKLGGKSLKKSTPMIRELNGKVDAARKLLLGEYEAALQPGSGVNYQQKKRIYNQLKQLDKIEDEVKKVEGESQSSEMGGSIDKIKKILTEIEQPIETARGREELSEVINDLTERASQGDQNALKELSQRAQIVGGAPFSEALGKIAKQQFKEEAAGLKQIPGHKDYLIARLLISSGLVGESENWVTHFINENKLSFDVSTLPLFKNLVEGGSGCAKKHLLELLKLETLVLANQVWSKKPENENLEILRDLELKKHGILLKPSSKHQQFTIELEKTLIQLVDHCDAGENEQLLESFRALVNPNFNETKECLHDLLFAFSGKNVIDPGVYLKFIKNRITKDEQMSFMEIYKEALKSPVNAPVILQDIQKFKSYLTAENYFALDDAVSQYIEQTQIGSGDFNQLKDVMDYLEMRSSTRSDQPSPKKSNLKKFDLFMAEIYSKSSNFNGSGTKAHYLKAKWGDTAARAQLQEIADSGKKGFYIRTCAEAQDYLNLLVNSPVPFLDRLWSIKGISNPLENIMESINDKIAMAFDDIFLPIKEMHSFKVEAFIRSDVNELAELSSPVVKKDQIILHIPFNQQSDLIDYIDFSKPENAAIKKINLKYNGLCELVCNYMLIEDLLGKEENPYFLMENITPENLNKKAILSSHILEKSSFPALIIAAFLGIYPDNIFSIEEQKKLVIKGEKNASLNHDLISGKLDIIEDGETLKVAVFVKDGLLEIDGHSLLLKKVSRDEFIFFDPNSGEHRQLEKKEVMKHLDKSVAHWDNIVFMKGKDFLRRLQNDKIVDIVDRTLPH